MILQCRCCGDFYRRNDEDMETIETDDGWVSDICRQCQTEFNLEALALEDAWQLYDPQLHEEKKP